MEKTGTDKGSGIQKVLRGNECDKGDGMKDKNGGGPAYPVLMGVDGEGLQTGSSSGWATGMTLRDYFAGQALAGYNANANFDMTHCNVAKYSYGDADAMLKARGI